MRRVIAILATTSLVVLVGGSVLPDIRSHPPATSLPGRTTGTNNEVLRSFGKLPLRFEPNMGQTDPRVRFVSRGPGFTLFLTSDGAVLSLKGSSTPSPPQPRGAVGPLTPSSGRMDVLSMRLLGANHRASTAGVDRLPGISNSFIGSDPNAWHTGMPTFAKVLYRDVYPGVDLDYYGNQTGRLEYDFTLAPGTDPSVLRLGFQGQQDLSIGAAGDLVLRLAAGEVRQPSAFAYQMIAGTKRPVTVSYVLRGSTVHFAVGAYDSSLPLVIDPAIAYSTYIGGTDYEEIDAIAVDRFGNSYLFGPTTSADFPITAGAYQPGFKGGTEFNSDDFVAKLNPTGTALIYSTYLGGTGDDEAFGMTIDRAGDAYLAGPTLSSDFPTSPGALQETAPGGDHDGFVTKLNPTGSGLVFSTYLGGSGHDATLTPVVNGAGDVYVLGDTNSTDLPVTTNAYQKQSHGGDCTIFNEFDDDCGTGEGLDMFVAKLNPTGSGLLYLTYIGGTGDEVGTGLDVDRWGNAYVAFETTSADYPVTPGAYQTTFAGGDGTDGVYSDAAVTKLNPAGSGLVYSTYLGGSGDECFFFQCYVTVDGQGHAFLASNSLSTDFPITTGAFQLTNHGGFDDTVTKLNLDGSGLIYSTYLGGSGDDSVVNVRTIAVRQDGAAYVSGYTDSTDFPTVQPVQGAFAGGADITLSVLNQRGSKLLFSTYLGGGDFDVADLNIDASGAAYLAGVTCSTDYPVSAGAFQTSMAGNCDGMVTKIVLRDDEAAPAIHRGPAMRSRRTSTRLVPEPIRMMGIMTERGDR
jgi:hypothetical protein